MATMVWLSVSVALLYITLVGGTFAERGYDGAMYPYFNPERGSFAAKYPYYYYNPQREFAAKYPYFNSPPVPSSTPPSSTPPSTSNTPPYNPPVTSISPPVTSTSPPVTSTSPPVQGAHNTNDGGQKVWCVAKPNADEMYLRGNIDFSCGEGEVDCTLIQPGGACFYPNTPIAHASYAMNLYYQKNGRNWWTCHFNHTGLVIFSDPSFGRCNYAAQWPV
eukprot:c11333_g1_i2 orf=197-853(-)